MTTENRNGTVLLLFSSCFCVLLALPAWTFRLASLSLQYTLLSLVLKIGSRSLSFADNAKVQANLRGSDTIPVLLVSLLTASREEMRR
jgi:hypothetical protein